VNALQAVSSPSLFNSNLYTNGIPPTPAGSNQAPAAATQVASTATNYLTSAIQLATDTTTQLQLLAADGNFAAQQELAARNAENRLLSPGYVNLLA